MSKKRTGGIIAGAVIVGGLALGGLNTVKIDPGYIGIIYDATHGGVNGETMKEGWNFKTPTQKVTEYSIALEQSYLTKVIRAILIKTKALIFQHLMENQSM